MRVKADIKLPQDVIDISDAYIKAGKDRGQPNRPRLRRKVPQIARHHDQNEFSD